jgi:hypothetical protein
MAGDTGIQIMERAAKGHCHFAHGPPRQRAVQFRGTNWAQVPDCYFDTHCVPQPLARVEHDDETEAWKKPGYRPILDDDVVSPASPAAPPPGK